MRLSADGLIRLSFDELISVSLVHLASDIEEQGQPVRDCGAATSIRGYTEWVSRSPPVITLGWDWSICATSGAARWQRVETPRSNIILVDGSLRDVDWKQGLWMLATYVDALPWVEATSGAIARRYAWRGLIDAALDRDSACKVAGPVET